MTVEKKYSKALEITPNNEWTQAFWDYLLPIKNRVSQHPLFTAMASGELSLDCFRYALLNFYPLVAHFPSYMAMNLAKATDFYSPGVTDTRTWLIQNIKVEERHLFWYRDWALGFGLSIDELDQVTPPAAMDAVNHFLWSTNYRCSLVEGIAATNLAIEWATSDWTVHVYKGIKSYTRHPELMINTRTVAWLRAHAHYDDVHPYQAMELIKRLCDHDPQMQQKALHAAERGLAYYELALDACYQIQLVNH
jgi:pyrroloquinoline quinone (PQQ) biosynthesis protein C